MGSLLLWFSLRKIAFIDIEGKPIIYGIYTRKFRIPLFMCAKVFTQENCKEKSRAKKGVVEK